MDAEQITQIVNDSQYKYFGLRAMTPNFYGGTDEVAVVGQSLPDSYHWIDGESTGERINGICAIEICQDDPASIKHAIKALKSYTSKQVALIGAYGCEHGDDDDEIILRNSEVLAVWSR